MMHNLISNYFTVKRLKAQIQNPHLSWLMFYDSDTKISPKATVQRLVRLRQSNIGEFSYIGHNSNVFFTTIGKFCSISRYVNIGLSSHPSNFLSTSPVFFSANNVTGHKWITKDVYDDNPDPITIGNDVWIGMNATIMGGVSVGNGAIIAAHSVVTKNVPPFAIVGGVPAKIIKYRFDELLIKRLEEFQWWDLTEDVLKKYITGFQGEISLTKLNDLIERIESENIK